MSRGNRLDAPELRRARALLILQQRIMGLSTAQVAANFNVTVKTIRREIDYAKRHNLVADYEEKVLEMLVPRAVDALKTALDGGDADVALEVLKGMGVLKKPSSKPLTDPPPLVEEESLSLHLKRITKAGGILGSTVTGNAELPAGSALDVIEGSLLEGASDSVAAVAPPVGAVGDESDPADSHGHMDLPADDAGLPPELPAPPTGDGA